MGDLQHKPGRVALARRAVLFRLPRRAAAGAEGEPLVAPDGGGRKSKKKRMAVARLGGAGGRRRLAGAFRRLRMRWLSALYRRTMRRLRAYYAKALEDLLEGSAVVSTLRSQAGADCSFGAAFAPVAAVGF